jgi:hypothetical protein
MKDKLILGIAAVLILFSVFPQNISLLLPRPVAVSTIDVPSISEERQKGVESIVESFRQGSSDRSTDGKRLASLYIDLARLIELDGDDMVIKNTEQVKQANSLAGVMLRLDIKDKYPDLAKNCNAYLVSVLGEDIVDLDESLRQKASDCFIDLAWACYEGSK